MKQYPLFCIILILGIVLLSGCNLQSAEQPPAPTVDIAAISTMAMQTISVSLTQDAVAKALSQPTVTPEPKAVEPTNTEIPTDMPTLEVIIPPTETPQPVIILPTETTAPTLTPQTPMLHVTEDTNCRSGPGPAYSVEGFITTAMKLPVVGINDGYSWWWVENPTYPGYHCWVWKYSSVVEGDVSTLPVYLDPWTPTPGTPVMSVDIVNWTEYQVTKCPVTLAFAAAIRTNKGGEYRYQWVKKNGTVVDQGWVSIAADGLAYISTSFIVKQDVSGSMQLRILSPIRIYSEKVQYKVDCRK